MPRSAATDFARRNKKSGISRVVLMFPYYHIYGTLRSKKWECIGRPGTGGHGRPLMARFERTGIHQSTLSGTHASKEPPFCASRKARVRIELYRTGEGPV